MIKLDKLKNWKIPVYLVGILSVIWFTSCEVDDFTETPPSGAAPIVVITTPDTVNFDQLFQLSATFSDQTAGLGTATFTVLDENQTVVFEEEVFLIGTNDEINIDIPAETFAIGVYTLRVTCNDTEGLTTVVEKSFFAKGILSNQAQMYILGGFNGWGGAENAMTLVADYTWTYTTFIPAVSDPGNRGFKFVNTPNFSDTDWSDPDCDFQAGSGIGPNIECATVDGWYQITFNDQTLQWSWLVSNQEGMWVLGSMNGWGSNTPDYGMTLIADYTWEVQGVAIGGGDEFKFANTPNFTGVDFSDEECDNQATQGVGPNINCGFSGTLTFQFNDETLQYSVN